MKEECKLFLTGLKDKKEYYTYAIKKMVQVNYSNVFSFPKTIKLH